MTRKERYKLAYTEFMKIYPFALDDLDGEQWRTVPDYEDYQCSNFGRVKSFKWGKQKILKPTLTVDGYLRVELHQNTRRKNIGIGRLVAICFLPNPDLKPEVDHIDTHKFNNHVSNLRWVTSAENIQAAFDTGLMKAQRGDERYNSSVTNAQAEYIRLNPDNLTGAALAKKFGVSQVTVSQIQLGKNYKSAGGTFREAKRRPLPQAQRQEVRNLYLTGKYSQQRLADLFNVTQSTIHYIIYEND